MGPLLAYSWNININLTYTVYCKGNTVNTDAQLFKVVVFNDQLEYKHKLKIITTGTSTF